MKIIIVVISTQLCMLCTHMRVNVLYSNWITGRSPACCITDAAVTRTECSSFSQVVCFRHSVVRYTVRYIERWVSRDTSSGAFWCSGRCGIRVTWLAVARLTWRHWRLFVHDRTKRHYVGIAHHSAAKTSYNNAICLSANLMPATYRAQNTLQCVTVSLKTLSRRKRATLSII